MRCRNWREPGQNRLLLLNRDRVALGSAPRSVVGSLVALDVPSLESEGASSSCWVRCLSSTKLHLSLMVHPDDWGQMARTACRLPSMPAHVPAHSWVLPHITVAWLQVWAMLHYFRDSVWDLGKLLYICILRCNLFTDTASFFGSRKQITFVNYLRKHVLNPIFRQNISAPRSVTWSFCTLFMNVVFCFK